MVGLVESASSILSGAQQRAGDAAHNISNMTTPGYRARHSFSQILGRPDTGQPEQSTVVSLAEGLLSETGSPLDLALNGAGFFVLDGGAEGALYTRNGQFERTSDGRLLGVGGRALQAQGGGDLIVPEGDLTVSADGSVLDGDRLIARIAVVALEAEAVTAGTDGLLRAPDAAVKTLEAPVVRQGFLEASNVSLGDEMISLMEAVRRAETGQRLMNVYDDLMGRALTTFGQSNG